MDVLDGITDVLVAQDVRAWVGEHIRKEEGVGVAHPSGGDLDQNLLRRRLRDGDVPQDGLVVTGLIEGSKHSSVNVSHLGC